MIIDFYSLTKHKTPNHFPLRDPETSQLTIRTKWFTLATDDPEIFQSYTPWELRDLFDEQMTELQKELKIASQYQLIKKIDADATLKQYELLYFKDWFAFLKDTLINQAQYNSKDSSINNVYIWQTDIQWSNNVYIWSWSLNQSLIDEYSISEPQTNSTEQISWSLQQEHKTNKKFSLPSDDDDDSFVDDPSPSIIQPLAIGISTSVIRQITGYTYWVQQSWHEHPVKIQWQEDLINSPHNVIVVDGSRQGWKSMTIAEKVIEESFIPGKDMMVAAFLQETTESIGVYMLEFIENFDDGTFTIKERKRYIQNNESGVRIHFRTLKDWAKWIRWKTLRLIVVDEAMLIPTSIFESILLPTQTTIENPKLILLWTAGENTSCYMYQIILAIKKGIEYNTKGKPTAKYIKFSVLENPLVSPLKKQQIIDNQNSPNIQREYFNRWWKLEDSLFQPKRHSFNEISTMLSPQAHMILAIDPARKQDRSAYVLGHCINGKLIIVSSGEVPPAYKDDWTLQWKFFLDLANKQKWYRSSSATIDVTGVGDWVISIFRSVWLPIQDSVRYTAGDTESTQWEWNYMVGKSLLINNVIDMFIEDTLIIPYETNKLLLEEMEVIQMTTTRMGKISFTSDFFDDITNAMMICAYIARKKRFLNRTSITEEAALSFESEFNSSYKQKDPRWARKQKPSGW